MLVRTKQSTKVMLWNLMAHPPTTLMEQLLITPGNLVMVLLDMALLYLISITSQGIIA